MELTPEIILLSPRVLSKRKPLEHKSFKGLYTSLYDEYSKGFIYLDYVFNNIEEEKDIPKALVNLKETKIKKAIILAQTTYSLEKFNIISQKIISLVDF